MQKGQIALVAGALVLVLVLYFGGKTVSKKEKGNGVSAAAVLSFEQYEEQQAATLPAASGSAREALVSGLKAASESDTATTRKLYGRLAEFWRNSGNPALASYYMYQSARVEGTKNALSAAGDGFVEAYKSGSDSSISNNLITFALRSFEEALQKDGSDIELKIKLADVYVQGSQDPMKGIGILRQLADSLPDNIPVMLALGRLSIQSGQFDKAKERLQKVLKLSPQNTEAMYFLAITEAEMGHNEEAIRLFEMCKLLVGNKDFDKEIDGIVKNLKNKKD